jgi:hypothetical protein
MNMAPRYLHKYLILILASLFYSFTLAPTIIAGDSPALSLRVHRFALHFGRASDHPLHTMIGKMFSLLPFELAFSLNLMSAFFGVLTILLIFLIIKHLTESDSSAWFGSLSLMVSHAFWLHSVIAEVYTLNAFFLALLVYLTLTKLKSRLFKYFFPLIFVLGLLNHLILVLSLPAFWVYILMNVGKRERKFILNITAIVLSAVIASLSWLAIFRSGILLSFIKGPPSILIYLLPPSDFHLLIKEFGFYILFLCYQYPLLGVIVGGIGIFRLFKQDRSTAVFLMLIIALNGLFFIKTTAWKSYGGTKYTFYISDYTIFAVFLGCGFQSLLNQITILQKKWNVKILRERIQPILPAGIVAASVVLTIAFYSLMPKIVSILNVDLVHARTLAYRDNNRFFLNPNKRGYNGDRKLGQEILQLAEKNSVVFADFTPYTILKYLMTIDNLRPDIKLLICNEKTDMRIQLDKIKNENPNTHIYLADNDYCKLDGIEEKYFVKQQGPFFEIVAK